MTDKEPEGPRTFTMPPESPTSIRHDHDEKLVALLGKLHRVTAKAKYIQKKGQNSTQNYIR